MDNNMNIAVNLDEALFLRSALTIALKHTSKEDLELFWSNADIPNLIKQLDIVIDVLFLEGGSK